MPPSMEATDNNENDVASCKGSDYTSSEVSDVCLPENHSAPLEAKCLLTDSGRYLPSLASPPVLSSSPSVRRKHSKNDARPFGPLARVSQLSPAHGGESDAKIESEMEAGGKPRSDHSVPDPLPFGTLISAEPNSVVQSLARARRADSFYEDEKITDRFIDWSNRIPGVLLKLNYHGDYSSTLKDKHNHILLKTLTLNTLLRSSCINETSPTRLMVSHGDTNIFLGHMSQGPHIYTVYKGNRNVIHNMPRSRDAEFPTKKTPNGELYQRVSWHSDKTPYLLFVPRDNAFLGPPFSSLRTPKGGFLPHVIYHEDLGWRLSGTILGQWENLEKHLRATLKAMGDLHPGAAADRMLPWEIPSWRFDRFGTTPHEGERIASRARDAFLPMMGAATMMFTLLDWRLGDKWRSEMLDPKSDYQNYPYNVDKEFFTVLEASVVGDRNLPRVGGIFDFSHHYGDDPSLTPRHRLEWLLDLIIDNDLPVPLYLYWGEITDRPRCPIPRSLETRKFHPTFGEIDYLKGLQDAVSLSPWCPVQDGEMRPQRLLGPREPALTADSDRSRPAADAVPSPGRFPEPEAGSGQQYGENYEAFFARREQRDRERANTESAAMKQQRLAREANAALGAPPGKKGARVFQWEDSESRPGFFIRRCLSRSVAADSWDEFTVGQRLFDGFRNEWDLCTALAPHEEPEIEDDYDYSGEKDVTCAREDSSAMLRRPCMNWGGTVLENPIATTCPRSAIEATPRPTGLLLGTSIVSILNEKFIMSLFANVGVDPGKIVLGTGIGFYGRAVKYITWNSDQWVSYDDADTVDYYTTSVTCRAGFLRWWPRESNALSATRVLTRPQVHPRRGWHIRRGESLIATAGASTDTVQLQPYTRLMHWIQKHHILVAPSRSSYTTK
ncbi:hypothetical protein C8R47DRAFT_1296943 [Mycena vitilis]|nr:hypothetical protein C8R47DRAFT_1296943 [Mycena vitilis]